MNRRGPDLLFLFGVYPEKDLRLEKGTLLILIKKGEKRKGGKEKKK